MPFDRNFSELPKIDELKTTGRDGWRRLFARRGRREWQPEGCFTLLAKDTFEVWESAFELLLAGDEQCWDEFGWRLKENDPRAWLLLCAFLADNDIEKSDPQAAQLAWQTLERLADEGTPLARNELAELLKMGRPRAWQIVLSEEAGLASEWSDFLAKLERLNTGAWEEFKSKLCAGDKPAFKLLQILVESRSLDVLLHRKAWVTLSELLLSEHADAWCYFFGDVAIEALVSEAWSEFAIASRLCDAAGWPKLRARLQHREWLAWAKLLQKMLESSEQTQTKFADPEKPTRKGGGKAKAAIPWIELIFDAVVDEFALRIFRLFLNLSSNVAWQCLISQSELDSTFALSEWMDLIESGSSEALTIFLEIHKPSIQGKMKRAISCHNQWPNDDILSLIEESVKKSLIRQAKLSQLPDCSRESMKLFENYIWGVAKFKISHRIRKQIGPKKKPDSTSVEENENSRRVEVRNEGTDVDKSGTPDNRNHSTAGIDPDRLREKRDDLIFIQRRITEIVRSQIPVSAKTKSDIFSCMVDGILSIEAILEKLDFTPGTRREVEEIFNELSKKIYRANKIAESELSKNKRRKKVSSN